MRVAPANGAPAFPLRAGEPVVLGREPLLNIKDTRISRRQLQLELAADGASAALTQIAPVPSFVLRAAGGACEALGPGDVASVAAGDAVAMLEAGNVAFRLEGLPPVPDSPPPPPEVAPPPVPDSPPEAKRARTSGDEDEGQDGDAAGAYAVPPPAYAVPPPAEAETRNLEARSLALPSLGTDDFRVPPELAAPVLLDTVEAFLAATDAALRIFVVEPAGSAALAALRAELQNRPTTDERLQLLEGDITRLRSELHAESAVLVNPANWRLVGRGGRVNGAVHRAAGPALEERTRAKYATAAVGRALPVALPADSPLRAEQGVLHVIHVRAPNMNPARPDPETDAAVVRAQLADCYAAALAEFAAIAEANGATSLSQQLSQTDVAAWGGGGGTSAAGVFPEYRHPGRPPRSSGSWKRVLFDYLECPDLARDRIFYADDDCVVCYDGFPKARFHLLVLPRPAFLAVNGIGELRADAHLPQLRALHAVGARIAAALAPLAAPAPVRCGYHAQPSLHPLHLHIVSQDFDSPCLKNKKHWLSFTTPFFVPAATVEALLEANGRIDTEAYARFEAADTMRCHRCNAAVRNMPSLKGHLGECRAAYPSP